MPYSLNQRTVVGGDLFQQTDTWVGSKLGFYQGEDWTSKIRYQVLIGAVLCVIIVLVYTFVQMFIRFTYSYIGSGGLVKIEADTRLATQGAQYKTDPNEEEHKYIKRSMNERSGLELTYTTWLQKLMKIIILRKLGNHLRYSTID